MLPETYRKFSLYISFIKAVKVTKIKFASTGHIAAIDHDAIAKCFNNWKKSLFW